jgi:hypothetical protein
MQTAQYKVVRLVETAGVCSEGRVMRVQLFGGSDATSLVLAGTARLDFNVAANDFLDVDFTKLGGVYFATDVEATIVGTDPVAIIFCDAGEHV